MKQLMSPITLAETSAAAAQSGGTTHASVDRRQLQQGALPCESDPCVAAMERLLQVVRLGTKPIDA